MNIPQCLFLDGFGHAAAELAEMFRQDMICLTPFDHSEYGRSALFLVCPLTDAQSASRGYARRIEQAREDIRLHRLFNGEASYPEGELAAFESAFGR
jgi:hypothetical protein